MVCSAEAELRDFGCLVLISFYLARTRETKVAAILLQTVNGPRVPSQRDAGSARACRSASRRRYNRHAILAADLLQMQQTARAGLNGWLQRA